MTVIAGRSFPSLSVPLWLLAASIGLLAPRAAWACPFCNATSQTLCEEIQAADTAILAQRVVDDSAEAQAEAPQSSIAGADLKKTRFRVVGVIKGQPLVEGIEEIDVVYFGRADASTTFLITGLGAPSLDWTTPLPLNDDAVTYVQQLPGLPAQGADRLAFFQDFLEHEDPLLAQDAYDEFARAPYSEVVDLKDRMQHDQLVIWVKDLDVPPSRRRLYLTMLSVCGTAEDIPMLEEMIRSTDRKAKMGLDAMIGCYLTLKGPDGLPLVEDLYLKDPSAAYQDTYATVMALRFHGQETDVIPRERILQAMRHLLDHPDLADQVIPDLARWEDWSVMDRLVELFKTSDDNSRWVRIPVVNYLREAAKQPGTVGQRATEAIAELKKVDPESVKRATTLFGFGSLAAAKPAAAQPPSAGAPPDDTPQPPADASAETTGASELDAEVPATAADAPAGEVANGNVSPAPREPSAAPETGRSASTEAGPSEAGPTSPAASAQNKARDTAVASPTTTVEVPQQTAQGDRASTSPIKPLDAAGGDAESINQPGWLVMILGPLAAAVVITLLMWTILRRGGEHTA